MSALAAAASASGALLEALARASLQGALFIAAVWLACRLLPRLPAAVRCGLWWAACLKLLVGLLWIPPVELPLLPAALTSPTLLSRPLPSHHPGRGGSQREQGAGSPVLDFPSPGELGGEGAGEEGAVSSVYFPSPGVVGREGAGEGPGVRVRAGARRLWGYAGGLALLWLAGLAFQSARAVRQLRFTRGVVRRSEPLREAGLRAVVAELCARLALRRRPEVRGSREVRTPQAVGLLRPLVLLPEAGLARLSPAEVSMTLCHELVHLRRGDLWLGWVPALAHRIFFFHPLAALAAREYAVAREAACDAEVLRVLGSAPQAYGRLLLRWGVAPRETGLAAAGAAPSLQNLKRRLQMLQQTCDDKRRFSGWWWLAGAAVLAGLIPLKIVAQQPATAPAEEEAAAAAEAPEPAVAEAAAPAVAEGVGGGVEGGVADGVAGGVPGGVAGGIAGGVPGGVADGIAGGVPGGIPGGVEGALAPGAPVPVAVPAALAPAAPGRAALPVMALPGVGPAAAPPAVAGVPSPAAVPRPGAPLPAAPAALAAVPGVPRPALAPAPPAPPKRHGYSFYSGDHGDSWILLYGKDSSTLMNGDVGDVDKVETLRGSGKEDILWFRHDGKEYVVRDAAVLKRAKDIFGPQMELGARQGALGAQQGALGAQQGTLGAQQGALGSQQAALGAQMAALAAKRLASDDDDREVVQRRDGLQTQMQELGRQQRELGAQQRELGRQQRELGAKQQELGRQQQAAGEKAAKEMQSLMEQSIRSGAAQPVK